MSYTAWLVQWRGVHLEVREIRDRSQSSPRKADLSTRAYLLETVEEARDNSDLLRGQGPCLLQSLGPNKVEGEGKHSHERHGHHPPGFYCGKSFTSSAGDRRSLTVKPDRLIPVSGEGKHVHVRQGHSPRCHIPPGWYSGKAFVSRFGRSEIPAMSLGFTILGEIFAYVAVFF